MPVYNVEPYLKEALDSVIGQTVDFKENIELIIVNDGSTDDSESIILDYKEKYPDNIVYIKQKNQGLSATRYNGFLKAKGEYIHSMDSDDTISSNFYEESLKFFNLHGDRVDMVASKLLLFEARTGGHYLNWRFKRTRIIDIDEEPSALQYHIASVVIRKSAIKKEWFDKKISIAEDARLIAILLHRKRAYGVISNISYNYRIRESGGSLINTQHLKRDFYLETPKRFWQFIIDFWRERDGNIAPYIQNLVMNDIRWRINQQKKQTVLSNQEEKEYKKTVYDTIFQLDDKTILRQEGMGIHKKSFLLKKKHGNKFEKLIKYENSKYLLANQVIVSRAQDYFGLVLDFIHSKGGGEYFIEGYPTSDTLHSKEKLIIRTSKGDFPVKYVERAQRRKDAFLGDQFNTLEAFETTIEVADNDNITGVLLTFTGEEIKIPIHTKRYTNLGQLKGSYRLTDHLLWRKSNGNIQVNPYSRSRHFHYELMFCWRILGNIRLKEALLMQKQAISESFTEKRIGGGNTRQLITPAGFVVRNTYLNLVSIFLRITHRISRRWSNHKPLWIISDRGMSAGDNGEAFFKYLSSLKEPPVDFYLAISRRSSDFERLAKIGPVVNIDSIKYKLLFLRASKIISSQADEYVINPFGMRESHMVDILNFDFVFLQHGVTKNDISDWLNRFFKNIKLFVTAAYPEQKSILEYPFYYSKNEVKLTGFPRFDQLVSEEKGKVMLAPTWRKYLTTGKIAKNGLWEYIDDFNQSDYYIFYNNLINDERVTNALKKANMIGEFYLHPSHSSQIKDFKGNNYFKIKSFPFDYAKAFRESNLLITDYSSVYFDFSYLNKPVIYTQFDRDYYYDNHGVYDRGYFSETRDGFGPVVEDYEAAVEEIVKSIENGCKLDRKYQERIDAFYAYHDYENSARVYGEVLKLER